MKIVENNWLSLMHLQKIYQLLKIKEKEINDKLVAEKNNDMELNLIN